MSGIESLNLLFIEPFYGGSHKHFTSGLIAHSRHHIELAALPARFWKWRMRGAALYFSEKIDDVSRYDGIVTTDMIDLTDLMALGGPAFPPCLVYFHENQLTYPLAPGETIDFQYGITNITTALGARTLLFNSHSHLNAFIRAASNLMKRMPDARVGWVGKRIREKAKVVYPGCSFSGSKNHGNPEHIGQHDGRAVGEQGAEIQSDLRGNAPPLIIWNHRWEFDKQPDIFFKVLERMKEKKVAFRLALLGERFREVPESFHDACRRFKDEIVVAGHVESRKAYFQWLGRGDLVVSTAIQENFGISVVEAVRFGALPLLPDRLSYPEIIPEKFHPHVLYSSFEEFESKLETRLVNLAAFQDIRHALAEEMARYAWETMIRQYDEAFDQSFSSRKV